MLVLALDTATPTLVAGVARWSPDGAEVLAERAVPSGTKHAELLTPAIRGALSDAGVALAELETFAAVYTSPRVRARDTALRACEALGQEPVVHEPLSAGFTAGDAADLAATVRFAARYGLALLDLRPVDNGGTWRALAASASPVLVGRATEDSLQHLLTVLAWMRTAGLSAAADRCVVAVMTTSPVVSRDTRAVQRQVEQTAGHVVRIGYDPVLARPHPIDVRVLHKATRTALTDLAAAVLRRCTAPGPAPITALGPVTPVPPAAPLPPPPPIPRRDEQ